MLEGATAMGFSGDLAAPIVFLLTRLLLDLDWAASNCLWFPNSTWSLPFLQETMTDMAKICLTGCWTALRSLIENMASGSPITYY